MAITKYTRPPVTLDVSSTLKQYDLDMILRFLAPLLSVALLAASLRAENDPPGFIVKNEIIPSPAATGAITPQLVNAPDGTVYLSWLEPAPASRIAFRFARFDATTRTWSPAHTISEGSIKDVPQNQTPLLAIADSGNMTALWYPSRDRALTAASVDGGLSWSVPRVLNRPLRFSQDAALQSLPDGRVLAVWIEPGRVNHALIAGIIGTTTPAFVIDESVSADSAPALAVFPDGSALVAYRGQTADGVHDIRTARFDDGKWSAPVALNSDGWKPAFPPRDGPALVARGPHIAAAWFTAAGDARINVSVSGNAGFQWLAPNRVDDVAPLGRIGLVLLDDGSQLVSWVERVQNEPVILLRRVSPRGAFSVPVMLARTVDGPPLQLARVKDSATTPAQLLLAYLQPAANLATLTTRLITLPDAASLAEADPCDCDPRPEDLRGYAVKGDIVAIDTVHGTLQLDHGDIPGVLKAATTTLKANPEVLRTLQPGQTLLARIEHIGPDWTLFNVHILASPK